VIDLDDLDRAMLRALALDGALFGAVVPADIEKVEHGP
jgi:hypothetical protein